ncbi:serine/threonine protein kinase [Usitatibacter palustris]|uniref:Stress response kinase A n=1 Tax=Usitatibacter palustris TaxID=2732487 RepID=A0A6M4H354_9PROT|nr:serine/threonine protein kinase [Usitatibacter palustris]QJR13999.1 Serine/threonine protein kinase RdoA [Usitatibacter palustris]
MPNDPHPYSQLTPDVVLNALDGVGLLCDGRLLALNSYENRVYQVGQEEGPPVVAKFYRPARWSDAQILEEHAFASELSEREVPVVAPLAPKDKTLHETGPFRFAVFPRRGGRAPELDRQGVLEWLGRYIGRIHAVGRAKPFKQRTTIDIASMGTEPRDWLLASRFIPPDLREAWKSAANLALENVARCFERAGKYATLRLHGDCHAGNVLWTDQGPHFVDLDDARMGPAVQDLWMLVSGDRESMCAQLGHILRGYEDFSEFDDRELHLFEALRTLRLIHYSAWLARRWDDPAFPIAFPFFDTPRYWQDRVLELREQIAAMQEAPLVPA